VRVPRVHLAQPLAPGVEVALDAAAARHLTRVLRLRPGGALALFNGDGCEYRARLLDAARVRVESADRPRTESPLKITLAQGIARGTRMDYIVQKAVELGVHALAPLATERSVVRLDATRGAARLAHWRAVAVSACEQSGRVRVPEIGAPQTLAQWLDTAPAGLRWLLDPQAAEGPAAGEAPAGDGVVLLIGPEGGLSPAEIECARGAGFRGIRLGPRVLRTETATVAALTTLQLQWGDLATGG